MVYCLDLLHLQRCQTYYGVWGFGGGGATKQEGRRGGAHVKMY